MNILIIGNSAAGTAAIEAIRRRDKKSAILQLSDEEFPLYSRCLLSYYLAGSSDKESLYFRPLDFHSRMDVTLNAGPGFRAVELDPEQQQVVCLNRQTFSYDRLLLATGASAKLPESLPANIQGIFMLRNWSDARAIKDKIPNTRKAVVLGGGLIGIKAASALAKTGIKTTIIMRSNHLLSQMIDFDASRIIHRFMEENNITIMHQTDIDEVQSREGKLSAVLTSKGDLLEADMLIAAKGVKPNTRLLDGTGINVPWGIETDQYMHTSHENIFAAGDVAQTYDIALGTFNVNALWTCAIQQGHVAGINITGNQLAYDGTIGMNALNIDDTSIISFGVSSPRDESKYRIRVLDQPRKNIYKKIVIGADNRIKGIILVGKIDNAGVLLSLIRRNIDIIPFEDELLSDRFNFGMILKHTDKAQLDHYYNRQLA